MARDKVEERNARKLEYVTSPEEAYFDQATIAAVLGLSTSNLEKRRVSGGGPAFVKFGHAVRYQKGGVERWLVEHPQFESTSEYERKAA